MAGTFATMSISGRDYPEPAEDAGLSARHGTREPPDAPSSRCGGGNRDASTIFNSSRPLRTDDKASIASEGNFCSKLGYWGGATPVLEIDLPSCHGIGLTSRQFFCIELLGVFWPFSRRALTLEPRSIDANNSERRRSRRSESCQ